MENIKSNQPEILVENEVSQDRLIEMLVDVWESQERGRLVDLPRWAQ